MVTARSILLAVLGLVVVSASLSACGKRGDLTPPPESAYPQQYPKQ